MSERANSAFCEGINLEGAARFVEARQIYAAILEDATDEAVLEKARFRMEDMDALIAEKAIYERIDENAKRVLSDIGIDIGASPTLLDLLTQADAIDFASETASFVPLKRNYIDQCLAQVPRQLRVDPGLNTFGTGSTSPFLKRPGDDELRAASREEYEEIIAAVSEREDVVGIFSLPVACDKSTSLYEIARHMEERYQGLKMMPTGSMGDAEAAFFKDKDHWLDGTSLITSLAPMENMVAPFLRSASAGNNLLLIDQSIAGISAPGSPEAFLTQCHAQVIFMMVVAQTVKPGIACVHCGIPSVTGAGRSLSYSSPHQTYINAAMARVNTWITGFPSSQTGGSTSLVDVSQQSISESALSRNTLRKYGVHIIRHALGALGSLNYFSLEKFLADCEQERSSRSAFDAVPKDKGTIPLYFPEDEEAFEGIREIAQKGGNPGAADHTLKNVDSFDRWGKAILKAAQNKSYYPQIPDVAAHYVNPDD